jgi:predicted ATPase/class 3 adenylate cyclase
LLQPEVCRLPSASHSGVLTFLFTDIEGSTSRWEADRDAMAESLRIHDEITAATVEQAAGEVVKSTGDGAYAVFATPAAASLAALSLRDALASQSWPDSVSPIRVRMGIHSGTADSRDGDYFGPTLNRASRIMDAGHGGQILISEVTQRLLEGSTESTFLGEYRLRDVQSPERIYQIGDPGTSFGPLRVIDRREDNLPDQVTSFVGRESELARLSVYVEANRLVTVTGPGGVGKTRLAVQTAMTMTDRFEAVHFVSLGNVEEGGDVDRAIASALGTPYDSTVPLAILLESRLIVGPTLLVIDNFEHLMASAAIVGHLVEAFESLHALVTSREALHLRAEHVFPLSPLEIPSTNRELSTEFAQRLDSVRLFEERAQAVLPSFAIDESNVGDVVEICATLDGLPLAIELAAARIRLFPAAQLLDRLKGNRAALGQGPVDAPERHRTIASTVAWSYGLLDDDHAALFRRLSVFAGGRSIEAVEAVCTSNLAIDGFLGVEDLADKSLITIRPDRTGAGRIEFLETIYAVASHLLSETSESDEVHGLHATYFADLAEEGEAHLRGRLQKIWNATLEVEQPNLNAALTWSFTNGEPVDGLRIVAGLRDFWFYRSQTRDLDQWTSTALGFIDEADERVRAGVLLTAGLAAYNRRDESTASLLADAASAFSQMGDQRLQGLALLFTGSARYELDGENIETVMGLIEEGLRVARESGATPVVAQGLNILGEIQRSGGDFENSRDHQLEALALSHQTGEMRRVAMVTHNLGMIAHHLGDDTEAERLLRESLDVALDEEFILMAFAVLISLSEQFALKGNPALAAKLIGSADEQKRRNGWHEQGADRSDQVRIREYVKSELGPDRYQREAEAGARIEVNDVFDLARAVPGRE